MGLVPQVLNTSWKARTGVVLLLTIIATMIGMTLRADAQALPSCPDSDLIGSTDNLTAIYLERCGHCVDEEWTGLWATPTPLPTATATPPPTQTPEIAPTATGQPNMGMFDYFFDEDLFSLTIDVPITFGALTPFDITQAMLPYPDHRPVALMTMGLFCTGEGEQCDAPSGTWTRAVRGSIFRTPGQTFTGHDWACWRLDAFVDSYLHLCNIFADWAQTQNETVPIYADPIDSLYAFGTEAGGALGVSHSEYPRTLQVGMIAETQETLATGLVPFITTVRELIFGSPTIDVEYIGEPEPQAFSHIHARFMLVFDHIVPSNEDVSPIETPEPCNSIPSDDQHTINAGNPNDQLLGLGNYTYIGDAPQYTGVSLSASPVYAQEFNPIPLSFTSGGVATDHNWRRATTGGMQWHATLNPPMRVDELMTRFHLINTSGARNKSHWFRVEGWSGGGLQHVYLDFYIPSDWTGTSTNDISNKLLHELPEWVPYANTVSQIRMYVTQEVHFGSGNDWQPQWYWFNQTAESNTSYVRQLGDVSEYGASATISSLHHTGQTFVLDDVVLDLSSIEATGAISVSGYRNNDAKASYLINWMAPHDARIRLSEVDGWMPFAETRIDTVLIEVELTDGTLILDNISLERRAFCPDEPTPPGPIMTYTPVPTSPPYACDLWDYRIQPGYTNTPLSTATQTTTPDIQATQTVLASATHEHVETATAIYETAIAAATETISYETAIPEAIAAATGTATAVYPITATWVAEDEGRIPHATFEAHSTQLAHQLELNLTPGAMTQGGAMNFMINEGNFDGELSFGQLLTEPDRFRFRWGGGLAPLEKTCYTLVPAFPFGISPIPKISICIHWLDLPEIVIWGIKLPIEEFIVLIFVFAWLRLIFPGGGGDAD